MLLSQIKTKLGKLYFTFYSLQIKRLRDFMVSLHWIMYEDLISKTKMTRTETSLLQFIYPVARWSIRHSIKQKKLKSLIGKLREIVPDISEQEIHYIYTGILEEKERALQAFQCRMLENIMKKPFFENRDIFTIVDIGDAAGTHSLYFSELFKNYFNKIETISVNLDPVAIANIKRKGLNAILCRAEDLDLGNQQVNLFTSFLMLEHLHDPVMFLRRLTKKSNCDYFFITVPYFKKSRVGLHRIRTAMKKQVSAEETHIFELNPEDWSLLFIHAGWKPIYSKIHYNYPKGHLASFFLKYFWRVLDSEGHWNVLLKRDMELSDYYQDWSN